MKKLTKILLIIILMITVTGCGVKKVEETDAAKFKKEYESLNGTKREKDGKTIRTISIPENNPIIYSNAKEIVKKMEKKETFVVYFGFSDCPWCRSVIEELIKAAQENEVDKIYYVDVKEIRDVKELDEENKVITSKEGSKDYMTLIEKMKDVLESYELQTEDGETISTGEARIYAPNVVVVSKGVAKQMESGNSDSQEDPYQKLTDKMKKETYNKFKCLFKCLDEEKTTCSKKSC